MAAFAAGLLLLGQPSGLFADAPSEAKPAYQASGTMRMTEILARWHREFGERNPYRPVARLKSLQEQLPGTRNKAGELFQNVTTAGGFGHLQKGHAVAFADLNNDGYQEVVINVGGAFPGDTFFDAIQRLKPMPTQPDANQPPARCRQI